MSEITTYPLNGIDYDAADAAAYAAPRQSGVYSAEEDFAVTAAGDMTVTVSAGLGWVRPERFAGYSICKRDPDTVTLPLADGTRPRIDRIVLRYDAAKRSTTLQVLTGAAASSPTPPEITRTSLVYDLCLAQVRRPAGSVTVQPGDITDTRLDESLCGVMRDGVTGIPTAQLLQQAQARIGALEEQATSAAQAADRSRSAAASSQTAAAGSASAAAKSASSDQQASLDAANSASGMTTSVEAAAKSADAAAKSQTAAATSAQAAQTSAGAAGASAEKAAEEARKAANYVAADKTLSIPGAPADAAATGAALDKKASKDTVLDPDGNAIFYSKAEVEAKIKEILAAQREEDYAKVRYWVSDDPTSPASFIGGTWERIENRFIMGASDTHSAGTTVEAGLPSPWGQINAVLFAGMSNPDNGGFFKLAYTGTKWKSVAQGTYGDIWQSNITIRNNGLFGKSDTVQPPAYCMYIWRRVA